MQKQKIIIIDIDGTIANVDHRKHLIEKDPPEWDAFYKACILDTPIEENIKLIKADLVATGSKPCFVTGRSDLVREETEEWLFKNFFELPPPVFVRLLHMRKHGDHQEDTELKKSVTNSLIFNDIVRVYEDRPRLIRMYKELGLDVVDVGPGEEF